MGENLIKTAVVTGGHHFDVIGLTDLFRGLAGVLPYIQHLDDFTAASQVIRDGYDVVLFYIFMQEEPKDEGKPWWAGKPRTALDNLGVCGQGLVILHHALLAYRGWSLWNDLVGVVDRGFGFHHGQQIHIYVENNKHPITQGLTDWEMIDETYTVGDAGPGNHILLTTDHPRSMRTLAWTHQYKNSRVFCLQSGHNNITFVDPNFRKVSSQGITWAANRI